MVMAKAPVAGRVKTRLCPPCTPAQAAAVAGAALADTLAAVAACPGVRRIVALDGELGAWLPDGFEVIAQRGGGLDERLAWAADDAGGAGVIVGMDTPQVTPSLLDRALAAVARGDAALGPASDGGYWMIGLPRPDPEALLGVPMSVAETGAAQLARLRARGYRVANLPELRDIDTWDDALAVAASLPGSHTAAAVDALRCTGPYPPD
jgi:hypothetical protein